MLVDPSGAVALTVFVAYSAVVVVLWRVNRVDYETIAASRPNIIRGIIVPIGIAGALLALTTTVFGWWQPVLFEESPTGPIWAWAVPALMVGVIGAQFAKVGWRSPNAALLPYLALGVLIVGFSEELLARGVVLVGFRGDLSELWAWLGSCLLFGLLHGINALFGRSIVNTVGQVVAASVMGSALYVSREISGVIFVPMLLHAAWDFGSLGVQATDQKPSPVVPLLLVPLFAIGLVAGWFIAT